MVDKNDYIDALKRENVKILNEVRRKSSVYRKFNEIYEKIKNEKSVMIFSIEKNELYCPELTDYILKNILPFYSIW